MKTFSFVLAAALSALSVPSFGQSVPAAGPTDYLVFSLGQINYSSSDFQGLTGAVGSITMDNFEIAGKNLDLVTGHVLRLTRGQLNGGGAEAGGNILLDHVFVEGTLSYAGSLKVPASSNQGARRHVLGESVRALPTVAQFFKTESARLQKLAPTQTASISGKEVSLNAASPLSVFQVQAGDLPLQSILKINADECTTVVVNIEGTHGKMEGVQILLSGGVQASQIIFNFPQAQILELSASGNDDDGIPGTVLAPLAQTDFENARITGGLYVGNLKGNGQVNAGSFNWPLANLCGVVPPPAKPVIPAPPVPAPL